MEGSSCAQLLGCVETPLEADSLCVHPPAHLPGSGTVTEGSLVSAAGVPPQILFLFFVSGISLKGERAAQPALKHSVDAGELMTLAQSSTNPQPSVGADG